RARLLRARDERRLSFERPTTPLVPPVGHAGVGSPWLTPSMTGVRFGNELGFVGEKQRKRGHLRRMLLPRSPGFV
ncbi:MAG: hypothetical protein ACYC6N_00225, partial [Pirellulaceae bacterium]